jgi:hypothetical protein
MLLLGNASIFKSTPFQVAGSFTVSAWIWIDAIYSGDPKCKYNPLTTAVPFV